MRKQLPDIQSIEFTLFDNNNRPVFKYKRAPRNVKYAKELLKLKGITL